MTDALYDMFIEELDLALQLVDHFDLHGLHTVHIGLLILEVTKDCLIVLLEVLVHQLQLKDDF